jgi:hypothetical protein
MRGQWAQRADGMTYAITSRPSSNMIAQRS